MASEPNGSANIGTLILNAASVPIFSLDSQGNVTHWNRPVSSLTGVQSDRIHGHSFQEMLLLPGQARAWNRGIADLRAGAPPVRLESTWRLPDGSQAWVTCYCVLVPILPDNTELVVCTVTGGLSLLDREALFRECILDRTLELREIARFIHDTISQDLVSLSFSVHNLQLDAAGSREGSAPKEVSPSESGASQVLELLDRCCRDIRVLGSMLAPISLADTPVESLIEQYAAYFQHEPDLAIQLDLDPPPADSPRELKFLLLAAAQLWIARAVRLGLPADIALRLRDRGSELILELETVLRTDSQQQGFPAGAWLILRERTAALGGTFAIIEQTSREFAKIRLPMPDKRSS